LTFAQSRRHPARLSPGCCMWLATVTNTAWRLVRCSICWGGHARYRIRT
jgi:hypothetical protein